MTFDLISSKENAVFKEIRLLQDLGVKKLDWLVVMRCWKVFT